MEWSSMSSVSREFSILGRNSCCYHRASTFCLAGKEMGKKIKKRGKQKLKEKKMRKNSRRENLLYFQRPEQDMDFVFPKFL